jgi:hypothetical protein
VSRPPYSRFTMATRAGERGMITHNIFDVESYRSTALSHLQAGVERVAADTPDRLAIFMRFLHSHVRVDPNGILPGRVAYYA